MAFFCLTSCSCQTRRFISQKEPLVVLSNGWSVEPVVVDAKQCGATDHVFCEISMFAKFGLPNENESSALLPRVRCDSLRLSMDGHSVLRVNDDTSYYGNRINNGKERGLFYGFKIVDDINASEKDFPLVPRTQKLIALQAYLSFRNDITGVVTERLVRFDLVEKIESHKRIWDFLASY